MKRSTLKFMTLFIGLIGLNAVSVQYMNWQNTLIKSLHPLHAPHAPRFLRYGQNFSDDSSLNVQFQALSLRADACQAIDSRHNCRSP